MYNICSVPSAGEIHMKTSICLFFAIIILATSATHARQERELGLDNSSTSSNRRIALVIGIGAYTASPLKNPPNDATDMAAALSELGFTVEHGVNLTQRQMKAMIREFGQKLKGGGQGLFYFAGHGVQLKGRNYLIPVDAEITSEADVEDQGVNVDLVTGLMDEAGNGLNVVILDACRNNPFARSFRSATSGLAHMDAPSGMLIAYATAPGSVASDGNARNGLYTQELLKFMKIPDLSIEEVFKQVRISVRNLTRNKPNIQTPWESSSLVGAFYFIRTKGVVSSASSNIPVTSGNTAAIELSFWESIKHSSDVDDYKEYLTKYPNGTFAGLARNKIRGLTVKPLSTLPIRVGSTIKYNNQEYEVLDIIVRGQGKEECGTATWYNDECDRLRLKRLSDGYISLWTSSDAYRESHPNMKYGFDQILGELVVIRY